MWKIGQVVISNPVVSAPMAGVTDRAFRLLARRAGAGLLYTEMVSDQALLYGSSRTDKILDMAGEPPPLSVQIFGSHPEYMAEAAAIVEARGATIIDINMGCPTPKIVKNGEGAALLRQPELAERIVRAVVRAVRVPVTVKMRIGWDDQHIVAVEFARMLQDAGASAVAVHGRTREQFYSGQADWQAIARVKRALSIPVIGNGDVRSPQDALAMLRETGCDAVMIGRASMGNPWIFRDTVHYLRTGEVLPPPSWRERLEVALQHLYLLVESKGEYIGVREMRKHAAWYVRGLRGAARLREELNRAETLQQMEQILRSALANE
ncbi:tRNA dihydrouridine synthase DusB [Desulfurispora thermophila]|uniref:tRNA dihydrouridine synthase DusB n=1 Tax=Desulfurispora thermophila TaxID=265470 RepID=UPI00037898E9|nr:tRNA dihydrouridine synthase DusB [Desulfurispora thermophila]